MDFIQPKENETEQQFVDRCVVDKDIIKMFPFATQRLRFCVSTYENSLIAIENSLK